MGALSAVQLADRRFAVVTALIACALLGLAQPLRWLDGPESRLIDLRFRLRGVRAPSPAILIIALDDASLHEHPALPTDPELHAELIRRLSAARVAAIGLDLPELARPQPEAASRVDGQSEVYRALTSALVGSGRVVLPTVWIPATGSGEPVPAPVSRLAVGKGRLTKPVELARAGILHPRADLCAAAAGLGALNIYPDRDWAVRQVPLVLEAEGRLYPSFALELARVAAKAQVAVHQDGGRVTVSLGEHAVHADSAGEALVNFAGPESTYPFLSYADVVAGSALAPELATRVRGKVVLVGATAVALPSRLRTPFSPYMTGVEVNANALDTLLTGRAIRRPPLRDGLLLTFLAAGLAAAAAVTGRPRRAVAAVVLLPIAALGLSGLAFAWGLALPTAGPLLAVLLVGGLTVGRRVVGEHLARRRLADHTESRMGALAGVGRLLNSGLNRQQLLTEIMLWVEDEIGCEASSLVLLRQEDRKLRFEVALGPKAAEIKDIEVDVGHGIVGTVVATGEPLVVPDTAADPRFAEEIARAVDYPAHSILCVPMNAGGKAIGAIEVINKRDGTRFTENDLALLTVIAQYSAMFLEMARLYAILEERVDLANRELRTANEQLSVEKAKLEAIVQNMADGIVAADEHGRIVLANRAAAAMLNVPESELFGRPAAEALPDKALAELFAGPPGDLPGDRELTLGDPLERIIRARPALAVDEHGVAGRVVVMSDITDLRELDRTKTDMVSFVSHELKNPLAAVKGFAGMIRDRAQDADNRQHAEIINRQAERMFRLINDFLNIARIDMGRELETNWACIDDVRPIVQEAIQAQAAAGLERTFDVAVPGDLPPFRADPDKLYQILQNLINNAAKYSREGGRVEVRAWAEASPRVVHFAIRDEGIGIPPESLPHLFQRFRRVTDGSGMRVEGTGLGLFLTRHLVQAHGGRIWAESEPGRGSTFHVVLPAGEPEHAHDPEAERR
jgi:signal transduction histidine kinase/CHASE2 domain-containing sensor protein/putative methionine-R-sulfoxide reductase with GAF domain